MKSKTLLLILWIMATGIQAQSIKGDWYGLLKFSGTQLKIVFHIEEQNGQLQASMDSPDQNAFGLKVDEITFEGKLLALKAKSLFMSYNGKANESMDSITGTFEQGSAKIPLLLFRNAPVVKKVVRPQDPREFPYSKEEVIFKNQKAGIELAGTLTLPTDKKVEKLLILVSGSGAQNRDEEVASFNHRPFLVWSDWLTRQGIGVLRYDDRGVGQSGGLYPTSTTADFATDAEAAVDYIFGREDLKKVKIGLMGHSEGGMTAALVAAGNKKVDFVILLAAPGIPIDQMLIEQLQDNNALEKVPDEIADLNLQMARKIYDYSKAHNSWNPVEEKMIMDEHYVEGLREILRKELGKYPNEAFGGMSVENIIEQQLMSDTSAWFRYFVNYVPAVALEKLQCPVLAVNGTLDCQVRCSSNLKAVEEALKNGGNKHYRIVRLKGMNHLLQKAKTGSVREYGQIAETVNPAALKIVSKWIKKL